MLLQTKFHIPTARTPLLARPHLLERLRAGQSGKVTLVSAPAGFGKTTVVAEWLRTLDQTAVAWLSLNKSDNDPTQFLDYLVGAIYKAIGQGSRMTQPVRPLSEPPQPNAILTALLNELSTQRHPLLLALDDYHLIDNQAVHDILLFLIEQMPSQLHLVLLTRTDPPLALARLRVHREITEVRSTDLRFTPTEVTSFLNQIMGLQLTRDQAAALEARTEGWVASLQLAALSLQHEGDADRFITTFSGSHRHILDYLTEEALQHQPPEVRDFLLKTSILERMSAPLCDLLTERSDSQAILTRLEQTNLFLIPLDNHRQWYRYHHLFADLLRRLLQAVAGDEGLALLHTQAARWFAEQEQMEDAVHHALTGGDYPLAVDLIVAAELAVENKGNVYTLMNWYKALPESLLRARPKLTIRYAHKMMMNAQPDAAEALLSSPWLADLSDPELRGEIAVLRGYTTLPRRDYERTAHYAQEAEALLPDTNDFYGGVFSLYGYVAMEKGDLEGAITALLRAATWNQAAGRTRGAIGDYMLVAHLYRQQTKMAEADKIMQACVKLVEGTTWTAEGDVYHQIAGAYVGRGEWSLAESYARKGLAIYRKIGDNSGVRRALLDLAFLKRIQRNYATAQALLQEAAQLTVGPEDTWGPVHLELLTIELAWFQGEPALMQRWLQTEPAWQSEFPIDAKVARCLYATLLATDEQTPTLSAQLFVDFVALLDEAEKKQNLYLRCFVLTLLALAEWVNGQCVNAFVHLQNAFDLAAPTGYLLCFLENGQPVQTLIQAAHAAGVGGDFAQKVLQAFEQLATENDQPVASVAKQYLPGKPFQTPTVLIEPLTEREAEVLALIAAGLNNQAIADRLVISVATVKRHISNFYGKLGVEQRTQALVRARELGLL